MVHMCGVQHADFDQMHLCLYFLLFFYFLFIGHNLHLTLGEDLGYSHVFSVQ